MPLRRRRRSAGAGLRLFFATDIHGSDICFRKFIGAASFYGCQILIMGGDITGKSIVPIERTSRGYAASFNDHRYAELTPQELDELTQRIRDAGQYPLVGERDELEALTDETMREQAFRRLMVAGIERWVSLAEERLRGTGVRCFITPGNDDYWEIDAPLASSDLVEAPEGRRLQLDERHEMITTGYSNPTPWHTPRELDEDALGKRLEGMVADCENVMNLVAVIHPPPFGSDLDLAPALDAEFRVQTEGGAPKMTSVGSTAVRDFIEKHQPLVALHGHVHDSRAAQMLGRTLCVNPGSDYGAGTLCGSILELGDGVVISHQFVMG